MMAPACRCLKGKRQYTKSGRDQPPTHKDLLLPGSSLPKIISLKMMKI